eukprot:scaffold1680_cov391-Prasinococcus_capsulatus_cf.AAC.7
MEDRHRVCYVHCDSCWHTTQAMLVRASAATFPLQATLKEAMQPCQHYDRWRRYREVSACVESDVRKSGFRSRPLGVMLSCPHVPDEVNTVLVVQAPISGFRVVGTYPSAGPYNLTMTAQDVLETPEAYPRPFYISYITTSTLVYHEVTDRFPEVLREGWPEQFLDLYDGTHTEQEIAAVMPVDPSVYLTEEALNGVQDDPSFFLSELISDQVLLESWTPANPMVLCHGSADEYVETPL